MSNKLAMVITIFSIICIIFIFGVLIAAVINDVGYGIKEGTIIDKSYHSAYTVMTSQTVQVGNTTTSVPVPRYYPETYNIKIQKEDGKKLKECWIEITATEYEKVKIGDYYGR